jgi:tRNA-2-methylthio-N6-dimethylallyladenosine synthase
MQTYNIWTIGCQMNKAETLQISNCLEEMGLINTPVIQNADLVVLNTCAVRQNAEDKVAGTLNYLRGRKNINPYLNILVTGCFVDSDIAKLKLKYPYVNLFFKPGDLSELTNWLKSTIGPLSSSPVNHSNVESSRLSVTAFVPIIQGCNNYCSYCIVPYRRGIEKSRALEDIECEVISLVKKGVKEITLLGQNVNSYGQDLSSKPTLVDLLIRLNNISGLNRIRFLTNHPKDMTIQLMEAMASLRKVCKHINLPVQSGDNAILEAMNRNYTAEQYCLLIENMRKNIPAIAISTDVIVGFPGETDDQFNNTVSLLQGIKFDSVHVATYSPRPGTKAAKDYEDNILPSIKRERFDRIEQIQTGISGDINSLLNNKIVEILVEGKKQGKWFGRTDSDKLVFFESGAEHYAQMAYVLINKTSPWALQGSLVMGGETHKSDNISVKEALS